MGKVGKGYEYTVHRKNTMVVKHLKYNNDNYIELNLHAFNFHNNYMRNVLVL